MSQAAPPSDKAGKSKTSSVVPPDERFWQRYSPHAELPLSSAGSLVVHILAFGLLLLASFLFMKFSLTNRTLPVEAVQFSGGGGNPHGKGEGLNSSDEPKEADNQQEKASQENAIPNDVKAPPKLNVNPDTPQKTTFDNESRKIQVDPEAGSVLKNLSERALKIPMPGSNSSPGRGQGGAGGGGGSGDGRGTGVGNASGPGVGTPSQREKRMLRWSMLFNTTNSSDYVAQLRGLGAILAIPVREDAANGICDYKVLRDLSTSRPAKFSEDDFSSIQRLVRWADENPESVRGVMAVLRLNLKPSHFLAFMPEELELKLLNLERENLNRKSPGHKEDDIKATKFRIRIRNGKYEPEVIGQELN